MKLLLTFLLALISTTVFGQQGVSVRANGGYATNLTGVGVTRLPIVVSGTNYVDRVEATNASSLLLSGGGVNLTIGSGTVTATSSGFSGGGANLTGLDATQLTLGSVPSARLSGVGSTNNSWTNVTLYGSVTVVSNGASIAKITLNSRPLTNWNDVTNYFTIPAGSFPTFGTQFSAGTAGTNFAISADVTNGTLAVTKTLKVARGAVTMTTITASDIQVRVVSGFSGTLTAYDSGNTTNGQVITIPNPYLQDWSSVGGISSYNIREITYGPTTMSTNETIAAFANGTWLTSSNTTFGTNSTQLTVIPTDPTNLVEIVTAEGLRALTIGLDGRAKFGSNVTAISFSGSGASLTALAAASITAGGTLPGLNGGSVTNLNFDTITNAWVANTAITLGQTNAILTSGAATIGVTGVLNLPTSTERFGVLHVIATGTITFTNPAAMHASDFLTTRTLTNGNCLDFVAYVLPGLRTNSTVIQF